MEEDSSRTISYQDASCKSSEENIRSKPALPSPSRSPSAENLFTSAPASTNVVGASRIHSLQDSADPYLGMDTSVLQPPQAGGGKPMHFKRGPGRPRKDGAGKSPKPVVSQKLKTKITGLFMPTGGRGGRGRKKTEGGPFVGGTNNVAGNSGDPTVYNHESPPPRFTTAEDNAESDTSSVASSFEKNNEDFTLFPEQWPGKSCALCNLGERSMLGQGELIRLDIPPGFDPHAVSRGLSVVKNEKDNTSDRSPKPNFSARRTKGVKVKRLTSQGSLESMNEPVDEVVGYSEEPDLSNIFYASSGYYYVHVSCAFWCDDVVKLEDGTFANLEKEIVRALSQHCSHCGNLGAGITCKAPGCGCSLHLACAATSGGFQEHSSRTTLCSAHIDLAVALLGKAASCTVCDLPGSISSLLMCCSCHHHYHSACLDLNSDPTIRAGWQCPVCKICQACRQPGDENKLLPCEACDKAYHVFCLRPALPSCPKYSWKCKMCRVCTDCGARTPGSGPSSRWHANFSVCDSCYQQRNKGLACPICKKAYRHVAQKHMVQCHHCKKYVHDTCDSGADLNAYHNKKEQNPDYEYVCIVCSSASSATNSATAHPRVLLSLKRSSDKDDASSETSSLFNSFTPSQDSFLSPEDDSQQGMENNTDLSWADKNSSAANEEGRQPPTLIGRGKPLTANFPKKKLGVGRPRSVDKQGALSSTSNKRQRFGDLQRKRGPKPKMRGVFGAPGVGLQRPSTDSCTKSEEEPGVENRLVLCSSRDEFVLQQDVCVMCGAFGNDLEGRLISCSQCGQCYHPFCVNIKVTKVVLQKGWRCLDCTVCEGCGQRHDEARLILCDDCDISFHIYCMDPPLDYVPQGTWKCKWCVVCQLCGSNNPGVKSTWHNNYTLCGPCASMNNCAVCKKEYTEGELIIQCVRCDRWLHASCDMINSENEAEKCADEDYQCVLCRPSDILPPHLQPPPPPVVAKAISPPRSPEPKSKTPQHFIVDGINLSETGMSHIKSMSLEQPKKKRKKVSNMDQDDMKAMEAGILAAIESVVAGSGCDQADGDRVAESNEIELSESEKRKQRHLQKLGIGGFIVRMRGPRFKEEEDLLENQSSQDGEKPKRKQARKKVKNKIVESFPSYLQEAFFGKTLMEPCKDTDFVSGDENEQEVSPLISSENYVKLSPDELKVIEAYKAKQEANEKAKVADGIIKNAETKLAQNETKAQIKQQIKIEEEDETDALQDILPLTSDLLDNDLVNTIMNEGDDMKVGEGLEDLSGVDSTLGDDGELSLDHNSGDGAHKDELTDFLSAQFNLESIDTGLPSMDSKDVEDIFKGVLTDESQESQDNIFPLSNNQPPPAPHPGTTTVQPSTNQAAQLLSQSQNINASVVISTPGVQGSPGLPSRSQLQQSVQQGLASPISFPPPSPYHSEYSNSPQFSPAFSEPPSPWPTQVDSEQEAPSNYSQRSILKWEADEALGLNATISAVLYANTNHPELKREVPNWAERSKQIAKIWRGLSAEKRAPYLQKARENRAASRMQKSQQIPNKENKCGGGTPSKVALSSSQSQSPDTDAQMKMSPSSSSSCSAPGSISSAEAISSLNLDSSGSSQLPSTGAGFSPSTSISSALTSATPSPVLASVSSCLMNNNVIGGSNNLSIHIQSTPPHSSSHSKSSANSAPSSPSMTSAFSASTTPLAQNDNSTFTSASAPKLEIAPNRCSVGDQQIRVLTPSEIMRTLPTLSHESCSFNASLDQDKIVNGPIAKQPVRGETSEERHWKQMQVFRQQQQQQQQIVLQEHRLQGEPNKEHLGGGSGNMNLNPTSKLQYPAAMAQVQRQLGTETSHGANNAETNRQPLQVTTSHEMGMPAPQSSPHLQSPNSRPVFGASIQSNRPRLAVAEMPPPSPSPLYSPRTALPQGSPTVRPPMYSRVPFMHSPRQPIASGDNYMNSPMTPQSVNDPYAHPPSTPRPAISEAENFPVTSESYQKMMTDTFPSANPAASEMDISGGGGLPSPRSQAPQGQETRQQLRDLLQRQQIKKLEQEQMSPGCQELSSPGTPRPVSWSPDDWQKGGSLDQNMSQNFNQRHPLSNPSSPQVSQQQSHFRQPFLPPHGRVNTQVQQQSMQSINRQMVPDYRPGQPNPQQQPPMQGLDSRVRLLLQQQQQQRVMVPQQQVTSRPPMSFGVGQQQLQSIQQMQQQSSPQPLNTPSQFRPSAPGRNTMDSYDHMVVQQRSGGIVITSEGNTSQVAGSSMLAQQLGRPLNSMMNQQQIPVASPPPVTPPNPPVPHMTPTTNAGSTSMGANHGVMPSAQADHQELPDSVTAELEKLEQEQHNEAGVEAESGELVDMGIDDDELLGMGADFNILEYADPELDQAVGGEKTNILDNLDLEEEKEEEKDDKDLKRKELEKPGKREPTTATYSSLSAPIQGATNPPIPKIENVPASPNSVGISNPPNSFMPHQPSITQQQSAVSEVNTAILRPPQPPPPPPYPVPPPPYPGRPQMGIRNGGGLSMQSMPSMMNTIGIGLKNAQMGMVGNVGLRPATHHLPSTPLSTSCNPLMSAHQRRTLLLQEQPLLLEDLLEQEKREQQRQGPGLMGAAPEEPLLSDFDFERLKADVLSSSNLPVSLSPPNVQGQVILPPPAQPSKFGRVLPPQMNQQTGPDWEGGISGDSLMGNRRGSNQSSDHSNIPLHPALAQSSGSNPAPPPPSRVPSFPMPSVPAPPTPPEHPVTEQDRQQQVQYEQWLFHQQQVLSVQLQHFEGEVNKLRKGKKSLNSKQRQQKKNGGELNEADAAELERITRELSGLQKQLDQSRKQTKQHGNLVQDYRNKQQKRQQMMGSNTPQQPPQQPTQASPLGPASHSPLHSTPQSPILSPSPSMGAGPVSSPLMQHHSPMASPLTPSPGPVPNSLSQASPRSMGLHHMDDRPFSPNNDNTMRTLASPQGNPNMQNRMVQQSNPQLRMGSPIGGNQPGNMQQPGQMMNVAPGMNQNVMIRGPMNVNMSGMHQQRPMYMEGQRMRHAGPPDQMRMLGPGGQRFPRLMNQEMMLRARGHQNQFQNPNQQQMMMSSAGQHYGSPQRVPFPNQSPTGASQVGSGMISNLRSPLPMNSLGGLGSPPGSQVMMGQNRVSPATSPMRRPSGSGSVGVASPLPDRPQSVENPLTPRSAGSGPHTPSSISGATSLGCTGMDGMTQLSTSSDNLHFHSMDNTQESQNLQSYGMFSSNTASQQPDYSSGGGGGGNPQIIPMPFPTFSWFKGPNRGGLKGGSPFSVVNGSPSHSSNIVPEQNQVSLETSTNTETFAATNHVTHAIEATGVSTNLVTSDIRTPVLSTEPLERAASSVKDIKIEAPDQMASASTKSGEPGLSNSMVFFSSAPSTQSVAAVPVSIEQSNILLNAIRNSTESSESSEAQEAFKKEHVDVKPNIDTTEVIGDMKKLVVLPKSGMQYLVTGVNNVIGLSTSNFPGVSTQSVMDINSSTVISSASVVELPPSSIHQANVGVLGGFRPTKNQAVISQLFEPNRLVPIQTIQSIDASKLQSVSHVQGTPVSLASFVADAVNAASLPFPQVSKSVAPGTYINSSVPLITVYSRPEMRSVAGNQHTSLTAVLLTSPRLTTSVTGQQQGLAVAAKVSQPGESQNALLKQLLQNTGCASMNQATTDAAGFSLTSFAKARPSPNIQVHTSSLSEAASRIPQPTPPVIRPPGVNGGNQPTQVRLPFKIEVRATESSMILPAAPVISSPLVQPAVLPSKPPPMSPQPTQPPIQPQPVKSPRVADGSPSVALPEEPMSVDTPTESSNSSIKDVIESVATDRNSSETTVSESRKSDDDVKKAKRRQYQPKKRPSLVKETSTPKKRIRKGSKLEEDYDGYMETLITQVRQLPPVNIMEPELGRNYNVCPIFGAGDYSKINTKGYSLLYGELSGDFGDAIISDDSDYYNSQPFGPEHPASNSKSQSSNRGFYHQEFAAPKFGSSGSKFFPNSRSPTPFRETDTPDTIVSSSSPECVMESSNMYPGLKLIDEDDDERQLHLRDSPVIPIFAPIPIRPVHAEQLPKPLADDIDKENISTVPETYVMKARQVSGAASPLKDTGNVTVTLTLSSNAAEDIGGVLRNLANVLSISAPQVYQVVERTITPPSQKLGLYTYKGKDGKEIVDIQSILNGTAKFCRHCDVVVLNNIIRKKLRDLPGISPNDILDESDELYFCSTTCFMQYAMTHGVNLPSEEKAGAVVKHPSEGDEGVVKCETNNLLVKDSKVTLYDPEILKSVKEKPNAVSIKTGTEPPTTETPKDNKLKRPLPADIKVKEEGDTSGKKWKGVKYKKWAPGRSGFANHQTKYKKPTEKEMTEMLFRMKITVLPPKMPEDARKCKFCHQIGDGISDGPGRLLNYDVDKWVHLNCALWSEEVYETENGALMNVEPALKQSLVLTCIICKQRGATVKCFKTRCSSVYHLGCAVKEGCVFYKNKTVFCSAHVPKGEKDNELTTLSVFRRVYVHRDENRQVAAVMHHADQHHLLRVGSLIFLSVGQLLPHQLQNFHTVNFIYPIGYKIVRFYWSMKRSNKRCQYICSIHEVEGKPEFRITPQEEGTKEVVIKSSTAQGAWHQVLDLIAKLRNQSNSIKVFPKYITGEDLFGLTEPAIVRVLESLPGIETLTDYNFKYGRNPLLELPLAINPTGCARSEPKLRTHFKRPHTQRTGGSSRTSSAIASPSGLSSSEAVSPYLKQFVHSKSSQYKKMKQDWRNNVYLARSKIQGLGLYAARDIEKHTMVIEYIGEIIRSELAELREKKYEAQNRGIYMFRVDEDRVIDATLCGGLARYINHSCNPNCVAETLEVDREWRIIIFSNRRISRGEELAYDYKFEFEDDQHKIQCFCGAPNCRQWMN